MEPQNILKKLYKKIDKRFKITFIWTLIIGLFTHFLCWQMY